MRRDKRANRLGFPLSIENLAAAIHEMIAAMNRQPPSSRLLPTPHCKPRQLNTFYDFDRQKLLDRLKNYRHTRISAATSGK